MRKILGNAKNLISLLGDKFAIEFYQREYRWETKQVGELIDDLTEKFNESYKPEDERSAVEEYGHYFLGSIIISDKEGKKFIIDGQQRLTTLSLLLIHIYRLLENEDQRAKLVGLICSTKYGTRSFNINVKERTACMEALFKNNNFNETGQPESVVNLIRRFQDVVELFPDDLTGAALPYFADWLIENVHLVEITTDSAADAYIIFETMNDRGLSLTPTEMLKGYILANIKDSSHRNEANQHWQKQVRRLQDINKKEDADAIKAWLRSKYAHTIRERKRDAVPLDFDLIGTEFHRWVRDHKKDLKLSSSDDYARFIEKDFNFYGDWYIRLHEAAEKMTKGLEAIHYCAQNNFTLQYPVLLAPLQCEDSEQDIMLKLRIVSAYLDILITRRIWNGRNIGYSTMQYTMFQTMRAIRDQDPLTLVDLLTKRLSEDEQTFATNNQFRLNKANRKKIRRLLARLIDYIETSSGQPPRYQEYIQFEIEHIWADNFERHSNEFEHPNEFSEYRDRIGGLLLLPKSFNASYGALPYEEKRNYYLQHDLLAKSLHEEAYEHNPGFKRFVSDSGLSFKSHPQFQKDDLDERQELYKCLAEEIWNPDRLRQAYEAKA